MTRLPHAPRSRRAGFTLVEMMIALTAGMLVISGVFFVAGTSARHFNEQTRVSEAQLTTRMALSQLRRDVARAGFLATRDSNELPDCGGGLASTQVSPVQIQAVAIDADAETAVVDPDDLNTTRADRLTLVGNYATGERYLAQSIDATRTRIVLQNERDSFRRSFLDPPDDGSACTSADFNAARFTAAFSPNRMLRVEAFNPTHHVFFRRIAGVDTSDATQPVVILANALPGSACLDVRGAYVAPVSRIMYRAEDFTDTAEGATLAAGAGVGADRSAVLVRRELDFTNATATVDPDDDAIAGTERPVLDYLVEFQLNLIQNTTPLGGGAPVFVRADTAAAVDNVSTNDPETIRALILTISARTDLPLQVSGGAARANLQTPLTRFIVPQPGDTTGVTRVRTSRLQLTLPNLIDPS